MKDAKISRRALGALGLAAPLATLAAPRAARAATWPDRPVTLVVPFNAGGASDTLARLLGQHFPKFANGQPLVVENRSGAGGMVGAAYVAGQKPDGYTLLMADIGANVIGKELNPGISYDPMTAFTPIMHMVNLPAVLIASPAVKEASLAEIIARAKRDPSAYNYASAGVGNGSHLFMALLCRQTGMQMTHVPYRSGSELVTSVMRGEVEFGFPTLSSALPMLKEKSVRPIAMGNPEGSPMLPGVEPVSRLVPGFDCAVWYGVAAPAGTPAALATRVNAVLAEIVALPEMREAVLNTQAGNLLGGSPEDFRHFLQAEYDRWVPVIREGGMRAG